MKNNLPDENDFKDLLGGMVQAAAPRWKIGDKVFFKINSEMVGMVRHITMYSNRFGYGVRWSDMSYNEHEAAELSDAKTWE